MIGEILSLAVNLIGGVVGKSQHDQYANLLQRQQKTMPEGVRQAQSIIELLSSQGLVGKEIMQQGVSDQVGRAYAQAKDTLGSYPDLFSYLTGIQTNEAAQRQEIEFADANQRLANKQGYAQFLTSVVSPIQMDIEQFNIDKTLGAKREQMTGVAELMQGMEQGVSGAINVYGQNQQRKYLQDKLEQEKSFWDAYLKGSGGGQTSVAGQQAAAAQAAQSGAATTGTGLSQTGQSPIGLMTEEEMSDGLLSQLFGFMTMKGPQ